MMEIPRALEVRGAGLADGQRQWRQVQEANHGAGPQAKRSPKERSAVPGTVTMVSKVALDDPGMVTPPDRPKRRLGSASKIAEVWGPTLESKGPGLVFLCLLLRLSQPAISIRTTTGKPRMRLNNLSARLIVNAWLIKRGHEPLASELSYEDFATELRKITAPTMAQVRFASRADAVAYVRNVARQHVKELDEGDGQ